MEEMEMDKKDHCEVTLRPHGPLVIRGDFEVIDEDGKIVDPKDVQGHAEELAERKADEEEEEDKRRRFASARAKKVVLFSNSDETLAEV